MTEKKFREDQCNIGGLVLGEAADYSRNTVFPVMRTDVKQQYHRKYDMT